MDEIEIVLKVDDPRIGKFAADGSYETRPESDVEGRPFDWTAASVRRLSPTTYVVIGADRQRFIKSITVEGSTPARTFPASKREMSEGAEVK